MKIVPDRAQETLLTCIKENIRPKTTIISDCFASYKNIKMLHGYDYIHYTVNHSQNFVDPVTKKHTQNIENTWFLLKMRNKRQCGTARNMLQSYLCEFVWRQKKAGECKDSKESLFDVIMNDIATFKF